MADKTIPQLDESTAIDENSLFVFDSGVQTFKIPAPDVAAGLRAWLPVYPDAFVSTAAELVAAVALLTTGGRILVTASFTLNSSVVLPANTVLHGRSKKTTITLGATGKLTLGAGCRLEDLTVFTAQASIVMVELTGGECVVANCTFEVPDDSTSTCVQHNSDANHVSTCVFTGVASPSTGTGLDYPAGYVDNTEAYNIFKP